VVNIVPIATSGSSWRNQLTGQPLICQILLPMVLTMQNQTKSEKKKI
jgi:hypothetical protein